MTTPTPAADSSAPAAGTVDSAAPAATAAPAAPAAPAAAAAPADTSLIPADGAASPPAPAAAPEAGKPAPKPNEPQVIHPEWFLADGTKGAGAPPAWYKADKYKSVAAQAEAYAHLEKKLGAFTGAPEGDYEFKLPEGLDGEFDVSHPMYKDLTSMAKEMQISNEGFNKLMGAFAKYEASIAPNPTENLAAAKVALGADADQRIKAAAFWAKANMTPEQFADFRAATNAAEMSGEQIARVVRVVEGVIGKTRVAMPKPGADVPAQTANKEQTLAILRNEKDAKGGMKYFSDPLHRAKVDALRVEIMNERGTA